MADGSPSLSRSRQITVFTAVVNGSGPTAEVGPEFAAFKAADDRACRGQHQHPAAGALVPGGRVL